MTWPNGESGGMDDVLRSIFGPAMAHIDVRETTTSHDIQEDQFLGETTTHRTRKASTMRIKGKLRVSAYDGAGGFVAEVEELLQQHVADFFHGDGRFEMHVTLPVEGRPATPLTDEALPEIGEQIRTGALTPDEGIAAKRALERMEVHNNEALDQMAWDNFALVRTPGESDNDFRERITPHFGELSPRANDPLNCK